MKLKIGNVTLNNNIILAPMAGVSDLPFRLLCHEMGAGLVSMEMVSAKAIFFHNKNTESLMTIDQRERPVALQLFGSDPAIISEMAREIENRPFDILDFNMGCPVPKIVNNGEGSALLKNPKLIAEIVAKTAKAINKPFTVKVRIGFEGEDIDIVEIAKIIEDNGAAAITVHGRTREQYYAGKADWDAIARVVEAINIPVIGNGDVDSPNKAGELLDHTGCAGVMIGRAARGNPWIFSQTAVYLEAGKILPVPTMEEMKKMMLRHARMQIQYKGDYLGIRQMRKHMAWYTSGLPHSSMMRQKVNEVESYEELENLLNTFM